MVQPGEVEVLLPPFERHQEDKDARESVDQHVRSGEVAAGLAICKFVSDSYVLFKQDTPCPSVHYNLCTYFNSGMAGPITMIFYEVKI